MKRRKILEEFKVFWTELEENFIVAKIIRIFYLKITEFSIDVRAAAIAYNFTLAVFPSILFFFSVLPYVPVDNFEQIIINFLNETLPPPYLNDFVDLINNIMDNKNGGLVSFGLFLALYTSTSGIVALIKSFNLTYKTKKNRGWLKERFIATGLNLLLTFILILSILTFVFGNKVLNLLENNGLVTSGIGYFLFSVLTLFIVFFIFQISISIIYYYAPTIQKKWKFFNSGSITASVLSLLVTSAFSSYLVNYGSYQKLYGSIGSLIALMIWLYLIALILIVGFEINASIDQANDEIEEIDEMDNPVKEDDLWLN